jgi:hypothetical protein
MRLLTLLLAFYLAAAGLVHFGAQPRPAADDPNMSVADEIRHERLADLAAAQLSEVWLEPDAAGARAF